jgi:hypothetical protein
VAIYVLLEHQSKVYRWMALRLLKYVVRQLEHWRRGHPDSELLPIILPVVLYHGPEGAWTAPRRVEELFDVPEEERALWWAVLPQFGYGLDDLTQEREEALRLRAAPALVRLVLLVLVYGKSAQLAQRMPGWKELFDEVYAAPNGEEEVTVLFHYLVRVVAQEDQALSCTDLSTLRLWLERAARATHLSQVLEELAQ